MGGSGVAGPMQLAGWGRGQGRPSEEALSSRTYLGRREGPASLTVRFIFLRPKEP